MRKIQLRLESLAVESFPTAPAAREPGTVEGRELTIGCQSGGCLPSGDGTCGRSCPFTCPQTCAVSCQGSCLGNDSCDGGYCPFPIPNTRNLANTCVAGQC
jgi:hypothetical protein